MEDLLAFGFVCCLFIAIISGNGNFYFLKIESLGMGCEANNKFKILIIKPIIENKTLQKREIGVNLAIANCYVVFIVLDGWILE